jgi:hypothetical protein
MSDVHIGLAAAGDDAGIRALVREQAIPGRVTIAFQREPDFSLGCAVTGDDYQIVVAHAADEERIVGVACRSTRRVFVNGAETRIGYLGQLRIDERYRGRWLVARGFALLREIDRRDPLPAYLVSIIDGNDEALGVLVQRRRPSFPQLELVAGYRTLAISLPPHSRQPRHEIVTGSDALIPDIARFLRSEGPRRQLFPVWSEEDLRNLARFGLAADDFRVLHRGGSIAGVAALWDQTAYKQTVVRGYSRWLKLVGPLVNLPRIGAPIRSAYAGLICIANDDRDVFTTLLAELSAVAARRGFEHLLVGLDARDPLLPAALSFRHLIYRSRLYLARWPHGGGLHERLDQRPVYVDIATL